MKNPGEKSTENEKNQPEDVEFLETNMVVGSEKYTLFFISRTMCSKTPPFF